MVIKWKGNAGNWHDLPASDFNHMPVSHAVNLLSGKIPVIVKEAGQYLVNTQDLADSYRAKGQPVMFINQVSADRFDKLLFRVGFVS